jgi:hypothetical protein
MVAPGVGGREAEHLAGAVDGQQRAELADVAGQLDARKPAVPWLSLLV